MPFPKPRRVFEEVDDALGEKLSTLIWEGPEETLTLTANAQPALMAVSMAAIRALEARGLSLKDKVAYVAGHSLGEYSALAAAGIVFARRCGAAAAHPRQRHAGGRAGRRGRHGGDHRPGAGRCRSRSAPRPPPLGACQIANDNGGGQLVISGAKAAVEKAASACTEKGAKRAHHAAGLRALPFGADGACRRRHARRAGRGDEGRAGRCPWSPMSRVAPLTDAATRSPTGWSSRSPAGALARDGGMVRRERRHHALSRSAPARC